MPKKAGASCPVNGVVESAIGALESMPRVYDMFTLSACNWLESRSCALAGAGVQARSDPIA